MEDLRRVRIVVVGMAASALATQAPASIAADDSARVSRLESEIQLLRSQLNEQGRRIERLEEELKRRGGAAPGQPSAKPRNAAPPAAHSAASGNLAWHSPAAWERIQKGMTVDEVRAILGEPTAVESVDSYKSLFYRGSTPAGAPVSGHVNFRDDRVVAVSKPGSQASPNP
jgi:hypothetical protein